MVKNDWLLTNMYNPSLDIYDLSTIGDINTDNTQFLTKDEYLKTDFIKNNENFKDELGNFSEVKFNLFYNQLTQRWNDLQLDQFPKGIELDAFDTSLKKDSRIKDTNFTLYGYSKNSIELGNISLNSNHLNPNKVKKGLEGWNIISDRTKSESEIAQSQFIKDPVSGEFLNETPESYALFNNPIKFIKNLFSDPLILATYEEGELDEQGQTHHKGEYKLNNEGTYFYEKLNGRSPIGKLVLSVTDILTEEDSFLNGVDFFDSDDLKKSPMGVIAKNAALIAPMFTPAAPYYYKAIIAKELVGAMPMLINFVNLFRDKPFDTPEFINTLAAKSEQFSTSSSTYSKENVFSFENFVDLVSDVAILWGTLKEIANAVNYFSNNKALKKAEAKAFDFYKSKVGGSLKGWEAPTDDLWKLSTVGSLALDKFYKPILKEVEKKHKLGGDLALMYMALISNTDVYNTVIEKGGTNKEAAWVSLGSTLGMFTVDKFLHLGEIFYDDIGAAGARQINKSVKNEIKDVVNTIYKSPDKSPLSLLLNSFSQFKNVYHNVYDKLKTHDLGLVGKALGEGFEEISEEAVTDLSKYTYTMLGDLGLYDPSIKNLVDYDTMFERYTMSFLGGTVGGGLFYLKNKFDGYNKFEDKDMVTLIREGKAQELRDLVTKLKKLGRTGNTKLSGLNPIRDSETGQITAWSTTEDKTQSQNDIIADKIIEKINALESILVSNKANLSEDELFDHMVMEETRYLKFKNASHITGYYQEFSKRLDNLITAETELRQAEKTVDGNPNSEEATDRELRNPDLLAKKQLTLADLLARVETSRLELNDFLSGDASLEYTRKLDFALDPVLNSVFLGLDYGKWLEGKMVDLENMTPLEQIQLQSEWNDHVKATMTSPTFEKGFKAFTQLDAKLAPLIEQSLVMADTYKLSSEVLEQLYALLENPTDPNQQTSPFDFNSFMELHPLVNIDSRLTNPETNELESEEDWKTWTEWRKSKEKDANTPMTDVERMTYLKRIQLVHANNDAIYRLYVDLFRAVLEPLNYQIDSNTARYIMQNMRMRVKDVLKRTLSYPILMHGGLFNVLPYLTTLLKLNDNLSNLDEVFKEMQSIHKANILSERLSLEALILNQVPFYNKLIKPLALFRKSRFKTLLTDLQNSNIEDKDAIIAELKSLKEQYDKDPENKVELENRLLELVPEQYRLQTVKSFLELKILSSKTLNEDEDETVGDTMTILEIIDGLYDPNSILYLISDIQPERGRVLADALNNTPVSFGKDTKFSFLFSSNLDDSLKGQTIINQEQALQTFLLEYIKKIESNPIYEFFNDLLTTTKSPLENIFTLLAKEVTKNPGDIADVSSILNSIYELFVNADNTNSFVLNEGQLKRLDKAVEILRVVGSYIYASTDEINKANSFSAPHKRINDFAENHKNALIKEWKPLPVIDKEYAEVLKAEVGRLLLEISLWKGISNANDMNKMLRLVNTEEQLNLLRYRMIKAMAPKLKFTIDDKEYNLGEGMENLPDLDPTNSGAYLSELYRVERLLHSNFIKITNEAKVTPEKFFEKAKFWEHVIGSAKKDIRRQLTTLLSEDMLDITKYDKIVYLLSLMSEDPTLYYQRLLLSIKDNPNIVPLTVQLNLVRLGNVAGTSIYKAGFDALIKYVDPKLTILKNSFYMNGTAGAGKTEVVLKNIRQEHSKEKALVIGPTSSQAIKLQKVLGEEQYFTFDEKDETSNIFKKLIVNWDEVSSEFKKASTLLIKLYRDPKTKNKSNLTIDNKFFTLSYHQSEDFGIGASIQLKDTIKFNNKFKEKLIFVDEAAWLSPLQLALLDKQAELVGGMVYLASDSGQSGFALDAFENVGATSIFTTRSSKLMESLRSVNALKLGNGNKLAKLLDEIDYAFESEDYNAAERLLKTLPKILKNIGLRNYTDDTTINGDVYDVDINDVLAKIPKDAEIGFIGKADSKNYLILKNAGFTHVAEPLTEVPEPGKPFMQGLEFDYVFIDPMENLPDKLEPNYNSVKWLRRFNTLATRGKVASIFLGKDLEPLLGKATNDDIKSKGFDILKLVDKFKEATTEKIKDMNLEPITEKFYVESQTNQNLESQGLQLANLTEPEEEPQGPNEEGSNEEGNNEGNSEEGNNEEGNNEGGNEPPEIVVETPETPSPELDPESSKLNLELALEEIHKTILETADEHVESAMSVSEIETENPSMSTSPEGDLTIEANTIVPILGAKKVALDPNKPYIKSWVVGERSAVRRNLAALVDNEDGTITKFEDKLDYQRALSSLQSAMLFGGDIKSDKFNFIGFGDAWKNRKVYLEVRPATEYDTFGMGVDLKPTYIQINGKPYVVALVCKLSGLSRSIKDEPFDAIFDLSLLSDPNKLLEPERKKAIITNLELKLKDGAIRKDNIEKVKLFIANLSISILEYDKLLKDIVTEHPDGYLIELDSNDYESHKTTRLVKRIFYTDDGTPIVVPRRLGGAYDIADVENHKYNEDDEIEANHRSFREVDLRKNVSSVYILGNKSDILKGKVSDSIFGKAVVFVSNNTNLTEEEMINHYKDLKLDPETHTPEVRMVPLINKGISFSELITHRIQTLLKEGGDDSKKPFRMDVLGIRMFTAMWNFRAGLLNFLNLLENWSDTYHYTEDYINNIVAAESALYLHSEQELKYKNKDWFEKLQDEDVIVLNIYTLYGVQKEDILNLFKFNLEYCKDIPIFRLGFDFTKLKIGGYVRSFDTSNSNVYGKKETNLIAINQEFAHKYESLLSIILNQLTANEPPALFKLANFEYKPMATTLMKADGVTPYETNEYIGRDELKRNLSGLIHTKNGEVYIGETDNAGKEINRIVIPSESLFSFFPKALSAICTKSRIYLTNQNVSGLIRIGTVAKLNMAEQSNSVAETTDYFNFDVTTLFGDNLLLEVGSDNTLFNMFNLIFHGTTESIESPHAYTEEAPFKYGIFVDTDLKYDAEFNDLNYFGEKGKDFMLLKCSTNEVYLYVNVDARPGGYQVNLTNILNKGKQQLIEDTKKNKEPEPEPEPDPSNIFSDDPNFIYYLNNEGLDENLDNTEENYNNFLELNRRKTINNLFVSGITTDDVVNALNKQLFILGDSTTLKEVTYNGDSSVSYVDSEDHTGTIDYDLESGEITLKSTHNTSNSVSENSLDSDILVNGVNLGSARDIRDFMVDLIGDKNDTLTLILLNSEDITTLENNIKTNFDSFSDLLYSGDVTENLNSKLQQYFGEVLVTYLSDIDGKCVN